MQESVGEEIEFDRELFYKCFEVIKKKRNSKYDFLIKSGKSKKPCSFCLNMFGIQRKNQSNGGRQQ